MINDTTPSAGPHGRVDVKISGFMPACQSLRPYADVHDYVSQ